MSYGILPTGFARKPLGTILAEIEQAMIATFGSGVIQTAQSPLGQLNGLMADLIAQEWELAEDAYQSYDPDQAEGIRLEILGRLRLVQRATGESDLSFRQAITNAGRARIDMQDLARAVKSLDGVTWAQVFVNDGDAPDANGISGHSVAVAALGGDEAAIARTMRDYIVPGIGTHGNTRIETTIDGFCRSIWLVRPVEVPVWLTVSVSVTADRNGCPPPAPAAIAAALAQDLSGDERPINGADVDAHMIRVPLARRHPNVQVVAVQAGRAEDALAPAPLALAFEEIAAVAASRITVTVV